MEGNSVKLPRKIPWMRKKKEGELKKRGRTNQRALTRGNSCYNDARRDTSSDTHKRENNRQEKTTKNLGLYQFARPFTSQGLISKVME